MAEKRIFNITGLCVPSLHYMVDISPTLAEIVCDFIEPGEYFTITRARQYGKTTMLDMLYQRLQEKYVVISLSFGGRENYFASRYALATGLCRSIARQLRQCHPESAAEFDKAVDEMFPIDCFSERITALCGQLDKPVVLIVDEADKASDYAILSTFLSVLRAKYIKRATRGTPTFHSVILASVHDITNLKIKQSPDEMYSYSSPWNIAARFDVDMSFSAPAIATMLEAYEQDHHTGMDIGKVAERLYYYTGGYPFLVSLLCKIMDEQIAQGITEDNVRIAVKDVLYNSRDITLFQDLQKTIEEHSDFKSTLVQILTEGCYVSYNGLVPALDPGITHGVFVPRDGRVVISNRIFEAFIYSYLISIDSNCSVVEEYAARSCFIRNGKLDMAEVLACFASFMRSEYREENRSFIAREGRLLFLSFLKSIVNGTVDYMVEPETRGHFRMDVVVFYGGEEQIVELKIWHGEQAASEAYDQLTGYLLSQEHKEGFLLSFCDNKKQPREGRVFEHNGCKITEVIVAYRDRA